MVPWWNTNLGEAEIAAIAAAVRGRHINRGPLCERLEAELARVLGARHVVATTSGSVALLLSLLACDVGAGDEVIVPAGAFIAPAHAALLLGATVRLADVRRDRPVLDASRLAAAVTERTKAVVAVHMNGAACDVAAVNAAAAEHGLRVIEDAAQAFGSRSPAGALGTLADAGAFSMGITKLITTGEGGFVATGDDAFAERLRRLRNHGVRRIADNRFEEPGLNFRFNDLQAAIALAQLARLDEKAAAVRRVHAFYRERLAGLGYIRMIESRTADGELPLWAQAVAAERDKVVALLARRGVEARPFHPSLADSPHLDAAGEFPNARWFAEHGLTLPSGTDQPRENLEATAEALRAIRHEIAGDVQPPEEAA